MPGGVGAQRSSWDVRRGRNCAEGVAENKGTLELCPLVFSQPSRHGLLPVRCIVCRFKCHATRVNGLWQNRQPNLQMSVVFCVNLSHNFAFPKCLDGACDRHFRSTHGNILRSRFSRRDHHSHFALGFAPDHRRPPRSHHQTS